MKISQRGNPSRFYTSLLLMLLASCLTWVTFAQPQPDPARCRKLQAIGERLQTDLERLENDLARNEECQGIGQSRCQARINNKKRQIERNRQETEIACAERSTPTPTPTPVVPPEQLDKCKSLQRVHDNLEQEIDRARADLDSEDCSGPARTRCLALINRLGEQLRQNAEQIRVVCLGGTPRPFPAPCPVGPQPNGAPKQIILETFSLFGRGGFRNPNFDTSRRDWAKRVCGGATWLSGELPPNEWTSILSAQGEVEDTPVAVSGIAINPHLSKEDVWFTHPFGNDLNFDVVPDPQYANLASPLLVVDPDEQGIDNSICKARTKFGLDITNVLHVEMDSGFVPEHFDAEEGNRVAVLGRWIVDCGHDSFGSEIHPPLLLLVSRPDSADTTLTSIISRPFTASQDFGDGRLFHHLFTELGKVYPPGFPFPVTDRVRARPTKPQKPFSGTQTFFVVIRPPTPRNDPRDQLIVTYSLLARSGVTVKFFDTGDDAVGLGLLLVEDDYTQPELPPRQNRNVTKAEIVKTRPDDVGAVIYSLQGLGIVQNNVFGSLVLERGVDTDSYVMPTVTDPPAQTSSLSLLNSIKIQPDDSQPWPIRGHITVQWKRFQPGSVPLPPLPIQLTVPANIQFFDTGVSLKQGQQFTIQASGLWSNTGPPALGPDGFRGTLFPGTLLPSASLGSLIAKIGNQTFAIGSEFEGPAPSEGRLFLSINDTPTTFGDNQGELQVKIFLRP